MLIVLQQQQAAKWSNNYSRAIDGCHRRYIHVITRALTTRLRCQRQINANEAVSAQAPPSASYFHHHDLWLRCWRRHRSGQLIMTSPWPHLGRSSRFWRWHHDIARPANELVVTSPSFMRFLMTKGSARLISVVGSGCFTTTMNTGSACAWRNSESLWRQVNVKAIAYTVCVQW